MQIDSPEPKAGYQLSLHCNSSSFILKEMYARHNIKHYDPYKDH